MYRIVGADQKEYGPVTAEQLKEWIGQGRANGQTVVKFEEGPWKPLATLPEFSGLFSTAPNVPPMTPPPIGQTYSTPPLSGAPVFGAARPYVPNYLVWSILTTLCCCLPTGIVAIVYSAQVNSKLDREDLGSGTRVRSRAQLVHRECSPWLDLQLFCDSLFLQPLFQLDDEFPALMQRIDQVETILVGRRPASRLLFGAAIGILILYYFSPTEYGFFPRCPLYSLTGWQCPGCGTLRAIHQLTHGHLRAAFHLNPLLVSLAPLIAFGFVREVYRESRGCRTNWNAIPASAIWALVALIISYGVLRNFISI